MTMSAIRVVLADDHKLFRLGIRALLQGCQDIRIVGEAQDGREALRVIASLSPDVALLDVTMPSLNGLEAAERIAVAFPRLRVVMLSMSGAEDTVLRALRAGAVGYLLKTADPTELELAIRAAARGERFLSSAVSGHIVAKCLEATAGEHSSLSRLSPRQREVLQLVAEGHTTKEIAVILGIGVKTAEAYRYELMQTLSIHDVANLTRYAIRAGLVSLDP
jgi:DNA-binding NarL/FixJ family response regulator